MKRHAVLLTTLIWLGFSPFAQAEGDIAKGEKLHNENCFKCHDTSVYTRKNRLIHTLGDLKNRVRFCESNNGLNWNDQQIGDVAAYLDKNFYRFTE